MSEPTLGQVWGRVIRALLDGRLPTMEELDGTSPPPASTHTREHSQCSDEMRAVVSATAHVFDTDQVKRVFGEALDTMKWESPVGAIFLFGYGPSSKWLVGGAALGHQPSIKAAYQRHTEREMARIRAEDKRRNDEAIAEVAAKAQAVLEGRS